MAGMPQPTENHKKLQILIGAWTGDEKLSPSPWGPGGVAKGRSSYKLDVDGFYVVGDYAEEKDGKTVFRGHSIFGWDDQQKIFVWYWFDSMGMPPPQPARGKWEGDTLMFEQHWEKGDSRYAYRFEGQNRYQFKIENSYDKMKTWQTVMEGDYRRE